MTRLSLCLCLLLLLLSFTTPALPAQEDKILDQAFAAFQKKDYATARRLFQEALKIVKTQPQPRKIQEIYQNLGVVHFFAGDYPQAIEAYEEALKILPPPEPALKLKILRNLANAHYKAGNYPQAINILEEILKTNPKLPPETHVDLLATLAAAYRQQELYFTAIHYYQQALNIAAKLKNPTLNAGLLKETALCQSKIGDLKTAIANLEQALKLSSQNPLHATQIYSNLGIIYWDCDNYPKALSFLQKAQEVARQHNLKASLCADLNNEGLVYAALGNHQRALAAYNASAALAQEIADQKSLAIALANRAIIKTKQHLNDDAMHDLRAAQNIYQQLNFREGLANCYLALGELHERNLLDYPQAYDYYLKAYEIFTAIANPRGQAEALWHLGKILRPSVNRQRTTRGLIFEEHQPAFVDLTPSEAAQKSLHFQQQALTLATRLSFRHIIWNAHKEIGYILFQQQRHQEALQHYQTAVNTVLDIRAAAPAELMGDYLKNKEELFSEAIEVLAHLYKTTNNPQYLQLQMQYQLIYENEIMKTAMASAKLNFSDKSKAELHQQVNLALAQKRHLESQRAQLQATLSTTTDTKDSGTTRSHQQQQLQQCQQQLNNLEVSLVHLLNTWKTKYPTDADLFDSSAQIDPDAVRKHLKPNQALLLYFPLHDFLNIICVTTDGVYYQQSDIPYEKLVQLIRDDFAFEIIEKYAHPKEFFNKSSFTPAEEQQFFSKSTQILTHLYKLLILPVEHILANKDHLIIVPNKYLNYIPFAALVKKADNPQEPHYLIYDKTISYYRLSFFHKLIQQSRPLLTLNNAKIIAVGNPINEDFFMPRLEAAKLEIEELQHNAKRHNFSTFSLLEKDATENAFRRAIVQDQYNIFYFATHGVPYAEVLNDISKWEQEINASPVSADPKQMKKIEILKKNLKFCREVFTTDSPLNSFLLLARSPDKSDKGLLTLKDILDLPEACFAHAQMAVLSACNTAVTFSPKVRAELRTQFERLAASSLSSHNWIPGVDQICMVDTFMKRNFHTVTGTFWMADDDASKFLMSKFFHYLGQYAPAQALRQAQLDYLKKPPLDQNYTAIPKIPYFWAVCAVFGN